MHFRSNFAKGSEKGFFRNCESEKDEGGREGVKSGRERVGS